jgi:hypothetical protein
LEVTRFLVQLLLLAEALVEAILRLQLLAVQAAVLLLSGVQVLMLELQTKDLLAVIGMEQVAQMVVVVEQVQLA